VAFIDCDSSLSGIGKMWDLGSCGARIEQVDWVPRIGTRLTLVLARLNRQSMIEMDVEVVRATETGGFAVAFIAMDSRAECGLHAILNRAAMIAKRD
jgi:hypothetical protein